MTAQRANIFAFATKGTATNEEDRLRALLSRVEAEFIPFEKRHKVRSFLKVLRTLIVERPNLAVMEGTGLAGGLACLAARIFARRRYVVSSGDAVGPFVAAHVPALAVPLVGWPFALYERLLYRLSDGFIGWTPYLVGRALTFGAPRAVTAAGWAPAALKAEHASTARADTRARLGMEPDSITFGIIGALNWNNRRKYCYGLELVQAIQRCSRPDVNVLIVGDGSGLPILREAAGDSLNKRVFLPGACPGERVPECLAAMDIASLPQSRDGVGSFRFTTKISEYLAAGLPIVTGRLPMAYDLPHAAAWRLPGDAPWSESYIAAMAKLMNELDRETLASARAKTHPPLIEFDADAQIARVTQFILELLDETHVCAEDGSVAAAAAGDLSMSSSVAPTP